MRNVIVTLGVAWPAQQNKAAAAAKSAKDDAAKAEAAKARPHPARRPITRAPEGKRLLPVAKGRAAAVELRRADSGAGQYAMRWYSP